MMENEKKSAELNEQELTGVAGGKRIGFGIPFSCTCPECGQFIRQGTMIGLVTCPNCGEAFDATDQAPEDDFQSRY